MKKCQLCDNSVKRQKARYCSNACSVKDNPKPQNSKQFNITLDLLEMSERETPYGQSRQKFIAELVGCTPSTVSIQAKQIGYTWKKRPRQKTYFSTTKVERKYVYSLGCVICGESRVVDAAHIYPMRLNGSGQEENIIPLCPTHHRLYDTGRMNEQEYSVMADFIIENKKEIEWLSL